MQKVKWRSTNQGLVEKGYSQVEGIDFGEKFSPVVKSTSIIFLLSIATTFDLEVEQMDVKTTFLHRDIEDEIYMKQLEGFIVKGKKELVCKLKKSLYGLKLRNWIRPGGPSYPVEIESDTIRSEFVFNLTFR